METRLRELRKEKGLTLKEAAFQNNLAVTTLQQYETGDRNLSPELIVQLAQFYGCTTDYLLCISSNRDDSKIKVLASLKGDKLELMKKANELDNEQLHDLLNIIDILYKKK